MHLVLGDTRIALIQMVHRGVEDTNHEHFISLMATTRTETTHGPTYSVARAIEATA